MSSISVYNANYNTSELLSKVARIFERDRERFGMAVQRSVTAKGQKGQNEHVITLIEVLSPALIPKAEVADYGSVRFSCEVLTLEALLARLKGLESKQFVVGHDIFQFDMNFGFNDHFEASNNCYGDWPGTVFEVVATYSQLPTGPLWHATLPSHDSIYSAIREFLGWKNFNNFSDARLGRTVIYIPSFNGRLRHLSLKGRELTVSVAGAFKPEIMTAEVLYSTNGRKGRFKNSLCSADEKITVDFVPTELRVLLFSNDGDLLDFHEETALYSNGCDAVLPKSKPTLVTPLEASDLMQAAGLDSEFDATEDFILANHSAVTLNSLQKKEQLLANIHLLVEKSYQIAVLVIDLDNFKEVNDTKGHLEGDACLESVVSILGRVVERKGTLYRWGGDEFAVVLPNFDIAEAEATAERIRRSVLQERPGGDVQVSASVGVTATDQASHCSAEELLRRADEAMYAAKKSGKDRVTSLPVSMDVSPLAAQKAAS